MSDDNRQVLACIDPFAVFNKQGIPTVYGGGDEVFEDDPILKSHRSHFTPVADRVVNRNAGAVERATAAPGEARELTSPPKRRPGRPRKDDTKTENTVKDDDSSEKDGD